MKVEEIQDIADRISSNITYHRERRTGFDQHHIAYAVAIEINKLQQRDEAERDAFSYAIGLVVGQIEEYIGYDLSSQIMTTIDKEFQDYKSKKG